MERLFTFAATAEGPWRMLAVHAVRGESLPVTPALQVVSGPRRAPPETAAWQLHGMTSHQRYTHGDEARELAARQQAPGRPGPMQAALIPIRKSAAWWALPQDERRAIVEEQSRHIAIGMRYLPAVARRLHHCRDLGWAEPFDFLTWFEFAPADAPAFDDLLAQLRATREWDFVEREVEVRLAREA